jgi:hypothetical protein
MRPLIASILASEPERSWFRIAKASLISSTRRSLTSIVAPFSMMRLFPLPARCNFASIDRTMGSRSGSLTALSSGAQKLGQPVPLSNFVVEENRSRNRLLGMRYKTKRALPP